MQQAIAREPTTSAAHPITTSTLPAPARYQPPPPIQFARKEIQPHHHNLQNRTTTLQSTPPNNVRSIAYKSFCRRIRHQYAHSIPVNPSRHRPVFLSLPYFHAQRRATSTDTTSVMHLDRCVGTVFQSGSPHAQRRATYRQKSRPESNAK